MDLAFFIIGLPLIIIIIALMFLLTARRNKNFALEVRRELATARQTGSKARARIVALQRAEVHRFYKQNLTTFKFLLEVFPGDLQPAFTASPVWELEAEAISRLQVGAMVSVIFDRANQRRIFPETPGVHYFQSNQHAYLGIENDFDAQEIVAVSQVQNAPPLASFAPAPNTIYRRRSQTVLFGLPLWEFAFNVVNKKGRMRHVKQAKARAIIAVGDSATGVIAIGGFAKGLISVGQFSFGLISFGCFSVGLLSGGLFGVGLLSLGVFGLGLLTVGAAFSVGYAAIGLLPVYARYEFGKDYQSPELLYVYEILKTLSGLSDLQISNAAAVGFIVLLILSFGFLVISFVAQIIAVQILKPNDNRLESPAY